ncbi:flagellar biosynthetic protein FliR, partial [Thalassolituus sp. UBA6592]
MFEIDALEVSHWISRYLYPFARISGMLMVMPLIGSRMIPMQIRLLLAVAITLVIVPVLPPLPHVDALSVASLIIILQQLLIGIALGFVVELVTQVFVLAGQLIAMQTGL